MSSVANKKILSYLRRAEIVAENSKDAETKVGAVLISSRTGSVISEGYNGFVRGGPDHKIPKTRPEKYEFVIHAETNLICNAARNAVCTDGCFVVLTHSPCVNCARLLHQAGISLVYFKNLYRTTKDMERLRDLDLSFTDEGDYYKMEIKPGK